MRKEEKLVQKVKGLVRKAGLPRWLHHMGPKKYEFWHHAIALVVKEECKLGFRRVSRLLKGLGFHVPSYSALQKMRKRIPFPLWKRLLAATCNGALHLVALDGTGLSFPLPSPYYYKRIDKPYPVDIPLKLSLAVDTKRKKILAVRLRVKPRHDIKDAKYLIDHLPSKPFCIIADKGYDANWLHEYCNQKDIKACIPKRNWNKPRVGRTKLRHTQKHYHKKRYGRREIIESIIGAIKRKFGMSVTAHSARTIRAEVYCRAITHNILTIFKRLFQRSLSGRAFLLCSDLLQIDFPRTYKNADIPFLFFRKRLLNYSLLKSLSYSLFPEGQRAYFAQYSLEQYRHTLCRTVHL